MEIINKGNGIWEVMTPGNLFVLHESDPNSLKMINDFRADVKNIEIFANIIETMGIGDAYNTYNNIVDFPQDPIEKSIEERIINLEEKQDVSIENRLKILEEKINKIGSGIK